MFLHKFEKYVDTWCDLVCKLFIIDLICVDKMIDVFGKVCVAEQDINISHIGFFDTCVVFQHEPKIAKCLIEVCLV